MFSSQTRLNATALYWEILKLKALIGLEKLLSMGERKHNDRGLNVQVTQEYSRDCVTALARKTSAGQYEVILPFAGKVLMDEQTFEQSHRPLQPALVQAGWDPKCAVGRSIYQKYIVVAPHTIYQAA